MQKKRTDNFSKFANQKKGSVIKESIRQEKKKIKAEARAAGEEFRKKKLDKMRGVKEEKVVKHQSRKFGVTKFGLERFVFGFLDLFSITFIGKFGKRPMHLFGSLGLIVSLLGFSFLIYIGVDKILLNKGSKLIANRTEFYVALSSIIIGVQFFLAGFIGEMLSRNSNSRNNYQIKEKLNLDD